MIKHFSSIEEVISDEDFLSWYAGGRRDPASSWAQWLSANPGYAPIVADSIAFLDQLSFSDLPVSQEQVERAHQRLVAATANNATVIPMRSHFRRWWLAAAVAIFLVVGGIIYTNRGEVGSEFTAGYGQVAQYQLPDGSGVTLNANSHVSIKKGWNDGSDREVWLEGEAFFEVKKESRQRKFIVHAEGMDIIVTGTRFNAVSRSGESNVLLTEGSVTLRMKDGKLISMQPGDFITVRNNSPQKGTAPEEKILAWKQSRLAFEKTVMPDAAKIIGQHYGVEVVLEKGVEDKTISGILPNDNLDVLLKALETAYDLSITKKDNIIYISNTKQ